MRVDVRLDVFWFCFFCFFFLFTGRPRSFLLIFVSLTAQQPHMKGRRLFWKCVCLCVMTESVYGGVLVCLSGNSAEGGSGSGKSRNVNVDQSVCVCLRMIWCFSFYWKCVLVSTLECHPPCFQACFLSPETTVTVCVFCKMGVRATTLPNCRHPHPPPIMSVGMCVCLVTLNERPLMNENPRASPPPPTVCHS